MFDIGFLEIMVILIIALLVIGPERMPELARKIGGFMGRMRRFINSVKEDGQMQETIKDFKDSMNIEEQQQQISNLNKELKTSLDFSEDLKDEAFQRPTFGGEQPPVETDTGGQFNRAPTQPNVPTPVVANTIEDVSATEPESASGETPVEPKTVSTEDSVADTSSSETKKS
ncbi:Sec-independent protein translocase protein TatB [Thiomicrorhabdus arctica]|uniref:Sec-independent protein translocase protein TatB n=1 Tax=Thiomicrorhabdus arctica TaxID=131540 RepID=UPI0003775651|nr:Sec-independent protein translocase protein TatB [Thiomicrorhabdus arctica]